MSIIVKDTKIYCNADSPINTIDGGELKNNIPFGQEGRNSQNYYGEDEGGSNKIEELIWQPGDLFGFTTGRTYIDTQAKTLYYEFKMDSFYRTNSSFLNWGSGSYQPIVRTAWVSSEYVTDDPDYALAKFDKRTDTKTVSEVKTANTSNKSGATTPKVATSSTDVPAPQSSNTFLYVAIAAGLGFIAWIIWGKK